jgi:alpha-tubulin suppressor-like RCC1 family protein
MDEEEDEDVFELNYNRIACTLNNSAAIANNGDVYICGRTASGILNSFCSGFSHKVLKNITLLSS